jgi:hypothetical protein
VYNTILFGNFEGKTLENLEVENRHMAIGSDDDMDWINLAQEINLRRALVNAATNFLVP